MASTSFRRILVPHDFSAHARRALRTAVRLAAGARGSVVVLHVVPNYHPISELALGESTVWAPPAGLLADARRALEREAAKAKGARVECRVELGDPLERILRAARRADLIVMSTHGRTGLGRLVIGSVAEKVVRHAPVPVLTIPAAAKA
jgi:nucleotide-binding universal stress UspA family protein